jgi:arsenate reductase (glutaredoxin)
MKVTIWHNPKCSTSRKVLELIRERGHEPVIIDYQAAPPSVADIKAVLGEAGLGARDLVRKRGTPYEDLGLDDDAVTDAALIKAMHEHPILIERPVVRTDKGTRLARPIEKVLEIL